MITQYQIKIDSSTFIDGLEPNASQKEEVRLAVIEDNKLIDLDIDFPSRNIKSNIYKGTISRVEPSLEAAFINFGRTRHGFLPFKEISP